MKLIEVIAALYFGAEVEYQGADGRIPKFGIDSAKDDYNFVFKMTGIELQTSAIDVTKQEYYLKGVLVHDAVEVPVSACKLLLTPLDKISTADIAAMAKIMGIKLNTHNSILKVKQYLTEKDYYWIDFGDAEGRLTAARLITYLRLQGYDIDDLIATGQAVDKTKMK